MMMVRLLSKVNIVLFNLNSRLKIYDKVQIEIMVTYVCRIADI